MFKSDIWLRMFCIGLMVVILLMPFTHGHSRPKRQEGCEYGTYDYEGRTCCLCPKGFYVQSHCTTSDPHSKCETCASGTSYTAEANSHESCDPCTGCNANANLQMVHDCTVTSNAVCDCLERHYCEEGNCKACHPCDLCEGKKVNTTCTPRKNTVCLEPDKGTNNTNGVVISVVCVFVFAVLACAAVFLWRRKKNSAKQIENPDVELQVPLRDFYTGDLKPHVSVIVQHLNWKHMKKVALETGMNPVEVERHKANNPGDDEEQTGSLLNAWIEHQGLNKASETFFTALRKCNLNLQAEQIQRGINEKGVK